MVGALVIAALMGLQSTTASAPARQDAPVGGDAVIPFAANGGLRDWRRDEDDRRVLYVRDRVERWYRITLSGPCGVGRSLDTLTYTTPSNGVFDQFSLIRFGSTPYQVCGIRRIARTNPPAEAAASTRRGSDRSHHR